MPVDIVSELCQMPAEPGSNTDIHRRILRNIVIGEVLGKKCFGAFSSASLRAARINFQACCFNHSDISPFTLQLEVQPTGIELRLQ